MQLRLYTRPFPLQAELKSLMSCSIYIFSPEISAQTLSLSSDFVLAMEQPWSWSILISSLHVLWQLSVLTNGQVWMFSEGWLFEQLHSQGRSILWGWLVMSLQVAPFVGIMPAWPTFSDSIDPYSVEGPMQYTQWRQLKSWFLWALILPYRAKHRQVRDLYPWHP